VLYVRKVTIAPVFLLGLIFLFCYTCIMALAIYVSNISNGSMKSTNDEDILKVNKSRLSFLLQNDISPKNVTLVDLKYEGDNYCRYITADDSDKGMGVIRQSDTISDAVVVNHTNHALFLPIADCIGSVLYDPVNNILMVSHLGRHNLEQNGGGKSINFLQNKYNVNPKKVIVWLSPAAGKDNYPLFAFENRSLHDVAIEQLVDSGVLLENISISPIDTTQDVDYFSHSQFLKGKQKTDGRFAIVALMTD